MKPKPKCVICGKPCELHDRNVDGTYSHMDCSFQETARRGWNVRAEGVDSPGRKESE